MILVTGATGLLGRHLLASLVADGQPVKALYRNTSKRRIIESFPEVTWVECDILDVIGLEDVFSNVKQVYHCAAMVSYDPKLSDKMIHTNVVGTRNVVNAALESKVDKMIYVSSIAVLGKPPKISVISEDNDHFVPEIATPYAISKFESEKEVFRGMAEGLNAAVVNPSVILGEGDYEVGTSAFFSRANKEARFYTHGATGFVDVLDVVEAMRLLMDSTVCGERFILSGENTSYRQIMDWISEALSKKKASQYAPPFLAKIIWRLEAIRAFFTQKSPLITKHTARSAHQISQYASDKFLKVFPEFTFTPMVDTIARIAQDFKKEG